MPRPGGVRNPLSQSGCGYGRGFLPLRQVERMAAVNLPRWVWFVVWLAVAVIVVILVALVVHALGGGILNLHLGHFVFKLGFT